MRCIVVLACWLMIVAGHAHAATQEKIGSWVLDCQGQVEAAESCLLRFEKPLLDKAGVIGELEVLGQGGTLVPVITLRGLSPTIMMAAAAVGQSDASLQFGGGSRALLNGGTSGAAYIFAPRDDAARVLSAGLAEAKSVTVRISFALAGTKPLSVQEKTLVLSATHEALTRLRSLRPVQVPAPVEALPSPNGLMEMADRALKAAGYPNGVASLESLLAKYRGK